MSKNVHNYVYKCINTNKINGTVITVYQNYQLVLTTCSSPRTDSKIMFSLDIHECVVCVHENMQLRVDKKLIKKRVCMCNSSLLVVPSIK